MRGDGMAIRLVAAVVLCSLALSAQDVYIGKGCTTPRIIDHDCDGYGIGEVTLGPDADDSDATVNTTASALAKYGTVQAYLQARGYTASRILYVSAFGGTLYPEYENPMGTGYRKQHITATASTGLSSSGDVTDVLDGVKASGGPALANGQDVHEYRTGDRSATITASSNLTFGAGAATDLVDGVNGTTALASQTVDGTKYIKFAFTQPVSFSEFRWKQHNTASHGVWILQASTNDSTWSNIGTSFTLGGATTQTRVVNASTAYSYRYWRLLGVSGTTSNTAQIHEVEFKQAHYVLFDFGVTSAAVITESKVTFDNTASHGVWRWQASAAGASWSNVGSTFTLGGAAEQTISLTTNFSPFRYWRLVGVSGTVATGTIREVEWKTDYQLEQTLAGYNNHFGSGDRQSKITITSNLTFSSGNAAKLIDGLWSTDASISAQDVSGKYIALSLGHTVTVRQFKFFQSSSASHGTWRFQGSMNGSDWTDIGSTFTLGGATTQTQTALSVATIGYKHYRLLGVSGTATAGVSLYEIDLQTQVGTANAPNDPDKPYSISTVKGVPIAGDAVVYRGGYYNNSFSITPGVGTASAPIALVAYPGEEPTNAYAAGVLFEQTYRWVIFDGFRVRPGLNGNGEAITGLGGANRFQNVTVKNVHASDFARGGFVVEGLNLTIEKCIIRDQGTSHNFYPQSNGPADTTQPDEALENFVVRDSLFYRTPYHNIHFNGHMPNFLIEGNYFADPGGANLKLDNIGPEGGIIRNNYLRAGYTACIGFASYATYETLYAREVNNVKVYNNTCIMNEQARAGYLQGNTGYSNQDVHGVIYYNGQPDINGLQSGSTQSLSHAAWTKTGATIDEDAHDSTYLSAPGAPWRSARENADTIVEDTSTGRHGVSQESAVTYRATDFYTGPNLWIQGMCKPMGRDWVAVSITDSTAVEKIAWFNCATKTWGSKNHASLNTPNEYCVGCFNKGTASDRWYKFNMAVPIAAGKVTVGYYAAPSDGVISYEGDGTSGIAIYGTQTSYQGTTWGVATTQSHAFSPAGFVTPIGSTNIFRNNVFATRLSAMLWLPSAWTGGWEQGIWENNIFHVETGTPKAVSKRVTWDPYNPTQVIGANYTLYDVATFSSFGPNLENPIYGSPQFVNVPNYLYDPTPWDQDPKLQVTSPGINAGVAVAEVTTDIRGIARTDGALDIGAYEITEAPDPILLVVNPVSLSFSCTAGGANPPDQSFVVNSSGGTLDNWNAEPTQDFWIQESIWTGSGPSTGTVSIINCSELAAGTYTDTITVTSTTAGVANSPQTVGIVLHVQAAAALVDRVRGPVVKRGTVEWK
jgi:hypothetical protein